MILLTGTDVRNLLGMPAAVEAAKAALRMHSAGRTDVPLRVNLDVPQHGGQSLFMPAHLPDLDSVAVKIVSVYPGNIAQGIESVSATVVLLDSRTGHVCAVMDGTQLTRLRTGAVQGAATDVLARADARVGALIGTGGQAASQLEAMLCVRRLDEVRVFDLDPERTSAFTVQMTRELGHHGARIVAATSSEAAVDGADVVTAVTTSRRPVLRSEHVADGTHVNGVGSYTPEMQELDEALVARADLVTIDTAAALAEAGSLIVPMTNGTLDRDRVVELGAVLTGAVAGRTSDQQVTVFDTVGSAVLDAVTAQWVYDAAVREGAGQRIEL